jgi:REP element-mobilizing transposase RayT
MKPDPRGRHRRSIRLKEYDYAQPGAYFVTIVAFRRNYLFGEIVDKEMQLNEFGSIADECWRAIPEHFPDVELGTYIVMPNHVHGIIVIHESRSSMGVRARHASPVQKPSNPRGFKRGSIGAIVASFKSAVTRRIGRERKIMGVWQRNYYEHIIRDEKEWDRIHRYIECNPSRWAEDDQNPLK